MAATQKKQVWLWSGEPAEIRVGKMAATQGVIMPGSPVELASGVLELSDTDDTTIYGFVIGPVDESTTWPITAQYAANTEVYVAVVNPDSIYAMYCDSDGTDSAVAQTNVGVAYGVTVGATSGYVGYMTCNLGETSNTLVTVVDIASNIEPEKYTTSDNPGVALVKFTGTLQG